MEPCEIGMETMTKMIGSQSFYIVGEIEDGSAYTGSSFALL